MRKCLWKWGQFTQFRTFANRYWLQINLTTNDRRCSFWIRRGQNQLHATSYGVGVAEQGSPFRFLSIAICCTPVSLLRTAVSQGSQRYRYGCCRCQHRHHNCLQAFRRGEGMEFFFESFLIERSDGGVDDADGAGQSSLARTGANHGSTKLDSPQSRVNPEGAA